jgi:molybdopterin-guanine dinucleotide biosynthesis protein A
MLKTKQLAGMKLSIVIQAGGDSRRMGRNKALLPFHGQTLIERVISRIGDLADELLITSNHPEDLSYLEYPIHPDIRKNQGALGGIHTALNIAQYPAVAVVACDMPFVNAQLLLWQQKLLVEHGSDGVVPSHAAGYEPFHAIYRRETCLPAVEKALDLGKKRADAWFKDVHLEFIVPDQICAFDPDEVAFLNINDKNDYQEALTIESKYRV